MFDVLVTIGAMVAICYLAISIPAELYLVYTLYQKRKVKKYKLELQRLRFLIKYNKSELDKLNAQFPQPVRGEG